MEDLGVFFVFIFPIVVLFLPFHTGHGHGFIGCIDDIFIVGVNQIAEDFPCLLGPDARYGFNGREEQGLFGFL